MYNDKIEFDVEYKIMITEGVVPKNKTFNAKSKIAGLTINYFKVNNIYL